MMGATPHFPTSTAIPPHDVTIVTPSIPPRAATLQRALLSAVKGSKPPDALSVRLDLGKLGAAVTRTRAARSVQTRWTAFLDDDDYLGPDHLLRLCQFQEETGADVVYPWFEVEGGSDPFPQFEGRPWEKGSPHLFPITALVRTEVAAEVGWFIRPGIDPGEDDLALPGDQAVSGEDWPFWLAVNEIATIVHLPERTWTWVHHQANTSGRPDRW